MKHRSKWHQRQHLIRLTRRRALAGSDMAYKLYCWLCDTAPSRPLGKHWVRPHVASYKIHKEMGWRELKV